MDPVRRSQNLPKNERKPLKQGRFNGPLQLLKNCECVTYDFFFNWEFKKCENLRQYPGTQPSFKDSGIPRILNGRESQKSQESRKSREWGFLGFLGLLGFLMAGNHINPRNPRNPGSGDSWDSWGFWDSWDS